MHPTLRWLNWKDTITVSNEIFFIKPNSEYVKKWDEFVQTLLTAFPNGICDGVTLTVTFGPLDAAPYAWRTRRHDDSCARLVVEVTNTYRSNVVAQATIEANNDFNPTPNYGIGLLSILVDTSWLEQLADMQAEYGQTLFKETFFDVEKFLAETDGKLSDDRQAEFLFKEIVIGEIVTQMGDDMAEIRKVPGMLEFLLEVLRTAMVAQEAIWKDDAL
jgi:hypothetical protein